MCSSDLLFRVAAVNAAGEGSYTVSASATTPAAGTVDLPSMSYAGPKTVMGAYAYFFALDADHGYELWRSDGTAAGTTLVKDIFAGPGTSEPDRLTVVGNTLYFTAWDGTQGGLWKSDGTAAGTTFVSDVDPESAMVPFAGKLFFSGSRYISQDNYSYGLWSTDGTPGGTVLVLSGDSVYGRTPFVLGSSLYVAGQRMDFPNSTVVLSKADATGSSFTQVGAIPGSVWTFGNSAVAGGKVFFVLSDQNGSEPWVSDGTAIGTFMLKDIASGSVGSNPYNFTAVGNTVYFVADDGFNGRGLWKTDGTAAGTTFVTNLDIQSALVPFAGKLIFSADDGVNGNELWISDGTATGTKLVKDLKPGMNGTSPAASYPGDFTPFKSKIYFMANGSELWQTDGTANGTTLVKQTDSDGGTGSSGTYAAMAVINDKLLFTTNDGRLWTSDGTTDGTKPISKSGVNNPPFGG